MNRRRPRAVVQAMVLVAVVSLFGASVSGSTPDTSAPPDTSPSPTATALPDPADLATGEGVPDGAEGSDTDPDGTPATMTVEAGDLFFAPAELSIPSDVPTTLVLVGTGKVAHNLIADDLGLQLHVGPGMTSQVTLSDVPPGTYDFYCSIFGHRRAGMVGTLTFE